MPSPPLRLLLLFQGVWEDDFVAGVLRDGGRRDLQLEREGFESFGWPHVLRLLPFDAVRWARRLAARYRGRVDAVWSNDDQFGALLAAVVARELGLPGADPAAIVRAQHKLLLRRALAAAATGSGVAAATLPWPYADRRARDAAAIAAAVAATDLRWPLFVKPVKGTFSALARRVDGPAQLAAHLDLPWSDRRLLSWSSRPFVQLARDLVELPCPPDHLLLEQVLAGRQVNVDGYAERGDVRVLGVIDERMYPGEVRGARHFAGFELPSRLPAGVQQRAVAAATAAVRAVGYDHGLFNVELFVQGDGSVQVIEVNARAAGQFGTLYRAVLGVDLERVAVQLAAGRPVADLRRHEPTAGAAGSFVFRRFDGAPAPAPSAAARGWLEATQPSARLWVEPAGARALAREYRWYGSHRHAVLNLAAADHAALHRLGDECARRLFGAGLPPAE